MKFPGKRVLEIRLRVEQRSRLSKPLHDLLGFYWNHWSLRLTELRNVAFSSAQL
jgi:hypothetical protein